MLHAEHFSFCPEFFFKKNLIFQKTENIIDFVFNHCSYGASLSIFGPLEPDSILDFRNSKFATFMFT